MSWDKCPQQTKGKNGAPVLSWLAKEFLSSASWSVRHNPWSARLVCGTPSSPSKGVQREGGVQERRGLVHRCHRRSTVTPAAAVTPGILRSLSFLFPTRRRCSMVRKSARPTDSACVFSKGRNKACTQVPAIVCHKQDQILSVHVICRLHAANCWIPFLYCQR